MSNAAVRPKLPPRRLSTPSRLLSMVPPGRGTQALSLRDPRSGTKVRADRQSCNLRVRGCVRSESPEGDEKLSCLNFQECI